jgi:hypothetical protein
MTIEVPRSTLTQVLFDLSQGDDEFVHDMMDMFGLLPPSEEGMETERNLSDIRMNWASPYAAHIEMISFIAAKISVCSTLEQPEDPDLVIERINELAAVMKAVVTTAFGAIAQEEFQRGHTHCRTTSG